jgi:hypothetical protein
MIAVRAKSIPIPSLSVIASWRKKYESAMVTTGYMALMNTIIETLPLLTARR